MVLAIGLVLFAVCASWASPPKNEELPEGDYDTLAGYIVSTLGRIPTENEHPTVTFENAEFTVEQVSDRRITKVRVVKNPEDDVVSDNTNDTDNSDDA